MTVALREQSRLQPAPHGTGNGRLRVTTGFISVPLAPLGTGSLCCLRRKAPLVSRRLPFLLARPTFRSDQFYGSLDGAALGIQEPDAHWQPNCALAASPEFHDVPCVTFGLVYRR